MNLTRLFSILLIFVISFGFITKSSIIIKYQLNKSEFIKNCINLNKPEKKCEGKCHLTAQLNESENVPANESVPYSFLNFEIPYFTIQNSSKINFELLCNSNLIHNSLYFSKLSAGYINLPFHPPIF